MKRYISQVSVAAVSCVLCTSCYISRSGSSVLCFLHLWQTFTWFNKFPAVKFPFLPRQAVTAITERYQSCKQPSHTALSIAITSVIVLPFRQ